MGGLKFKMIANDSSASGRCIGSFPGIHKERYVWIPIVESIHG